MQQRLMKHLQQQQQQKLKGLKHLLKQQQKLKGLKHLQKQQKKLKGLKHLLQKEQTKYKGLKEKKLKGLKEKLKGLEKRLDMFYEEGRTMQGETTSQQCTQRRIHGCLLSTMCRGP